MTPAQQTAAIQGQAEWGGSLAPPSAKRIAWDAAETWEAPQNWRGGSGLGIRVVVIGVRVLVGALVAVSWGGGQPGQQGPGATRASTALTGSFVRWDAVDESHGYAYFTVTNRGAASAVATCTVVVKDDFGSVGFDYMTGESVAPGQTLDLRMALSVSGEGAYRVAAGEVRDC